MLECGEKGRCVLKTCWDDELAPEEIALWQRVRRAVQNLPILYLGQDERGEPIELSCHLLARAAERVFKLAVETGKCVGPSISKRSLGSRKPCESPTVLVNESKVSSFTNLKL